MSEPLVLGPVPGTFVRFAQKQKRQQQKKQNKKNGGAFAFDAKFLLQINFSIKPFWTNEPVNNFKVLF